MSNNSVLKRFKKTKHIHSKEITARKTFESETIKMIFSFAQHFTFPVCQSKNKQKKFSKVMLKSHLIDKALFVDSHIYYDTWKLKATIHPKMAEC